MAPTTPTAPPSQEIRIGDYLVTGKIGQGGIAEIYRGRQVSLGRDVAIKVLSAQLSSEREIVRRFERESMVIARLSHPNIVSVIDRGTAGGRYYFVMEYVNGSSLREVIDSDKVSLKTKIEMLVQVLKALDYAHKNGVIHRDIKPANILIDRQGNARVADFGIAQIVGTPDSEVTSSDVIMGTVAYMSPEQKVSSTNVDATTDLYAIGIILYEILLGKKPMGRFKMPSEELPDLDPAWDEVVQRCLAPEPKDRYPNAEELKHAILDIIAATDRQPAGEFQIGGVDGFAGKCRHLDTIKETRFSSTILVENRSNKRLYVIKKHAKGEVGRKEAKLLASLRHRNIIGILGAGGDTRSTVIITDYAAGGSLADRMVRKYDWRKAMVIAGQIAEGLSFAHTNGIVHGNLRPSNILFDRSETVKLTDFGMPQHYDGVKQRNWYAPPEHKASKAGDVYAVGVVLHQLITGRNPQYDHGDNLRLDDVERQLPEMVQTMLRTLLAIRVPHRYATMADFLTDLSQFEEQLAAQAVAPPSRTPVETQEAPLWNRYLVIGGVVSLLVVILVTLLLIFS